MNTLFQMIYVHRSVLYVATRRFLSGGVGVWVRNLAIVRQ